MSLPALPLAAVLALALGATQLGGCVAAAALAPLAAGGAIAGKAARDSGTARPQRPQAEVTVGAGVAVPPPQQAPDADASADMAANGREAAPAVPDLTVSPALPAKPDAGRQGYAAFADYVLSRAQPGTRAAVRKSMLIDQRSLAANPALRDCDSQRGAVLIDLDVGKQAFDLDDPPAPAAGLADHLRAIRATGVAVLWIASLPEGEAKRLGTILKATGLDPLGIDPVVLLRPRETRKQQILDRLDREWCVLAIAGDRKADFDEVFDYLRDPEGLVALALEQHMGAGWFLVPPPIT